MNKLLIFGGIVILLFGGLFAVVQLQKKDDTNLYNNQVTLEQLVTNLTAGGDATVYFYSPECVHCQKTTPVVVPLAEEMNVNLEKLNVDLYPEAWELFGLNGTPTIIHFEQGSRIQHIEGARKENEFKTFFDSYVLN